MAISLSELNWAAGFLEGEGCFHASLSNGLTVSANQVQEEPLLRLKALFGGSVRLQKTSADRRDINVWTLCGAPVAGVMMTLFNLMSPWRKDQITTGLRRWLAQPLHNRLKTKCSKGHLYTEANTQYHSSHRHARECKECRRVARKAA